MHGFKLILVGTTEIIHSVIQIDVALVFKTWEGKRAWASLQMDIYPYVVRLQGILSAVWKWTVSAGNYRCKLAL